MKVLHVIPSLSPVHGGPTAALAAMERALAAQGVDVETATTNDDGPGHRNGKALGAPLQENGATHWYFAKRMEFYKPAPAFAHWVRREVGRFDLVHIHALFSFTTWAASAAARRAGVPYVVRPLGTLNGWGLTQRRPRLKNLSMRWVEAPLLRQAAAVHFTSEAEAAEAALLGIEMKAVVIPLGVDAGPATVRGLVSTGPFPRLLFLSRLDAKKNVEGLLAAVALLQHDTPGLRLQVVGDGETGYVAQLKARAQALGVAERVTWLGHLQGTDKAAAFAEADVFVLPSFSENFGIAAAEALAAGLPCVLGEGVAIAKEVVRAQAGTAVAPDASSIAEGVRRIIADRNSLEVISANAKRLAQERFSVDAMGARLKQLYADILNGSNEFSRPR